jgi:hypothetical protein
MFIIPLFPALFSNRFFADWTFHSRGSAPLLPLLCHQFSSQLFCVAHSTVYSRFQPKAKAHLHVSTLVCLHSHSTFVLHSYFCLLLWTMGNAICMAYLGHSDQRHSLIEHNLHGHWVVEWFHTSKRIVNA